MENQKRRPTIDDTLSQTTQAAYAAFQRELPKLLGEHPGKIVFYHGSDQLAITSDFDATYRELIDRGYADKDLVYLPIEPHLPLPEDGADWTSCDVE